MLKAPNYLRIVGRRAGVLRLRFAKSVSPMLRSYGSRLAYLVCALDTSIICPYLI